MYVFHIIHEEPVPPWFELWRALKLTSQPTWSCGGRHMLSWLVWLYGSRLTGYSKMVA